MVLTLGMLLSLVADGLHGSLPTEEIVEHYLLRAPFSALAIEASIAITIWRVPWAKEHPMEVIVGESFGLGVGILVGVIGLLGSLADMSVRSLGVVRLAMLLLMLASGLVGGHIGIRVGELIVSLLGLLLVRCTGVRPIVDGVVGEATGERVAELMSNLADFGAGGLIGIFTGAFVGGLVGSIVGGCSGGLLGSRRGDMVGHASVGVVLGSRGGMLLGLSVETRVKQLLMGGVGAWDDVQGYVGFPECLVVLFGMRFLWAHALPSTVVGVLLAKSSGGTRSGWVEELCFVSGILLWRVGFMLNSSSWSLSM